MYCLDEESGKALPVPESFVSIDDFNIKYIPESENGDNNLTYHAFVLFPGNQIISNTGLPVGMAEMHCRQMAKMGFQVHPVSIL